MKKFLILSLVLSIGFSSLFLFPRVASAGWSAPVGPFASDPSKPGIKDTISMSGVFSSVNSEVSSKNEYINCYNYSDNDYEQQSPCFNSFETCWFIIEGIAYPRICRDYSQFGRDTTIYKILSSEKLTVITTYKTIQIKWKNSKNVEHIETTSGRKEVYYYNCSNVDCIDVGVGWNDSWLPNTKTLVNYNYAPLPAQSYAIVLPLNTLIRFLGGPECSYQYGTYQNIVDCATFGLSADGRIGDARYHNSVSMDNSWWDGFTDSITFGITDLVGSLGQLQSVSSITNYGTVENSNSLGVGNWGWSGFYGNSNSGFIIPPPTVNLSTKTQYEIFKPTDTANVGLSWNSTYADSCVASGDWSGSKNIGNPNAVSEYLPKPRGDYSFTLGCSGSGGSVEKTATTKVIQIPQCNFSADKSSIVLPDTATLSWSCDYVSGGSGGGCSINQNIGSVGSSGSKEIRPSKTTSYLLTCNGLDGSNSFETTVNINTPLKIKYQEVIPR